MLSVEERSERCDRCEVTRNPAVPNPHWKEPSEFMRHLVHPAVCIFHLRPLTKPRNDRSRSKEPPPALTMALKYHLSMKG